MGDRNVPVAKNEEIPPGSAHLVNVDGKDVALFNVNGRIYAVGNRCPHRSGPLVKGRVETVPEASEGQPQAAPPGTVVVRCPIHGWLFELETGKCLTRPGASVPTYPVTCSEQDVCLGAPQGAEAGPSMPVSAG